MIKTQRRLTRCLRLLPYCLLGLTCLLGLVGHADASNLVGGSDAGTNWFSGLDGTVDASFKEGLMKYIYIAEFVATGIAWVKTKSPLVLLGLPILMIATHFFAGQIT